MPRLPHAHSMVIGAVLFSGLVLPVCGYRVVPAADVSSPATIAAEGRRLILLYGDKRVDLRAPSPSHPEDTAGDRIPDPPQSLPPVMGGATAARAKQDLPDAIPLEPATLNGGEERDSLGRRGQGTQRLFNTLRSADAASGTGVTRLPPLSAEEVQPLPSAPPAAPPVKHSPPISASTLGAKAQSGAGASTPATHGGGRQVAASPVPRDVPRQPIDWLEQRLTWLVVILLCTVVCLIVFVVQLLAAMGRLSRKLVPTIRLEMSDPNHVTVAAAYGAALATNEVQDTAAKRTGAVADFANESIPVAMLQGDCEKQRGAELERRKQQEQAILKDIFQDNLALRDRMQVQAIADH